VIWDTNYGVLAEDIMALGLLLQISSPTSSPSSSMSTPSAAYSSPFASSAASFLFQSSVATTAPSNKKARKAPTTTRERMDLRAIVTTSDNPFVAAQCVARHWSLSGTDLAIPILAGSRYPTYTERGGKCAVPGSLPVPLLSECQLPSSTQSSFNSSNVTTSDFSTNSNNNVSLIQDALVDMLMSSDRDDWVYIVSAGQTTLRDLIERYPGAASKIQSLVIQGGQFCNVGGAEDTTQVSCDPRAANTVLDASHNPIANIYYIPVHMADIMTPVDAAQLFTASAIDPIVRSTLHMYRAWLNGIEATNDRVASQSSSNNSTHTTNSSNASTTAEDLMTTITTLDSIPLYHAAAVLVAWQIIHADCPAVMSTASPSWYPLTRVQFVEAVTDVSTATPRIAAPSNSSLPIGTALHDGGEYISSLPFDCPTLTSPSWGGESANRHPFTLPVHMSLGFSDASVRSDWYHQVAAGMAGVPLTQC
jgi:inosine-uridine nucleoside N-ribohydrolase